jgi:hypothetical protein
MAMEIVNGYPCFDCTDVERAKKGENPARPAGAAPMPAADETEARDVNRPLAAGDRGTRLNLLI